MGGKNSQKKLRPLFKNRKKRQKHLSRPQLSSIPSARSDVLFGCEP